MSDVDRQSFILAIFLKWKKQLLQIFVMCLFMDIYSSNVTPMLYADVLGLIVELDTSIFSITGDRLSHSMT